MGTIYHLSAYRSGQIILRRYRPPHRLVDKPDPVHEEIADLLGEQRSDILTPAIAHHVPTTAPTRIDLCEYDDDALLAYIRMGRRELKRLYAEAGVEPPLTRPMATIPPDEIDIGENVSTVILT